jgi:outer membrane protein assembly factor BamB
MDVEPSAGAVDFGAGRVVSAGDSDAFLAAFSEDGHCLWARAIGGPNFDMAKSVVPAGDGGFFLTGLFQRDVPHQPGQLLFSLGGFEGFVARYSARGEELWRHRYPAMTSGHALALTPSGALVLAGHFTSALELGAGRTLQSAGKNVAVVAAFGPEGDIRWAHRLGGSEHDFGYAVTSVGDGVAVAGMSASKGFLAWLPLR